MENHKLASNFLTDNESGLIALLNSGFDPNFEGGWPIRLAARHGYHNIVKTLIQYGANPHILGPSGASTLQLAVYSGKHWEDNTWNFLLSYCDSSQLADGAAVAIIFGNVSSFTKILQTGRLNMHIPTTLTGKTLEQLAKGYKLHHLIVPPTITVSQTNNVTPTSSPRRQVETNSRRAMTPQAHHSQRNLSPSVARFFLQTANQITLTATQSFVIQTPSANTRIFNN